MGISFKGKIVASTALAAALLSAYARRSYAAPCPGTYAYTRVCDGYYSTAITFSGENNLHLQTGPSFSADINVTKNSVINMSGYGALSFTDSYNSLMVSRRSGGIRIISTGDYKGAIGSIGIDINSTIRTYGNAYAILANNEDSSSGGVSISVGGDIGSAGGGIFANNGTSSDGSVHVSLKDNSKITAGKNGVTAYNWGIGGLVIDAGGSIESTGQAIRAVNYGRSQQDLVINTGADSVIRSTDTTAIYAENQGRGALRISIDGEVEGAAWGVEAFNRSKSQYGVDIVTGKNSLIKGDRGLSIQNEGYGSVTLDLEGDIDAARTAVNVRNAQKSAGGINIQTGARSKIMSHNREAIGLINDGTGGIRMDMAGYIYAAATAISAGNSRYSKGDIYFLGTENFYANANDGLLTRQHGAGNTFITLNGDIAAKHYGMDIYQGPQSYGDVNITTGVESMIYSHETGIYALNNGYGRIAVALDGDIKSKNIAVGITNALYSAGGINIQTGADSRVEGAAGFRLSNAGAGRLHMDMAGDVYTAGTAIYAANEAGSPGDIYFLGRDTFYVQAGDAGLVTRHNGLGNTFITLHGDINAVSNGVDIYQGQQNYGDVNVTTGAESMIYANNKMGIYALNNGHGGIAVALDGDISSYGVAVGVTNTHYSAGGINIQTGTDSRVESRGGDGIVIADSGTGGIHVDMAGDVYAAGTAIYARNTDYNQGDLYFLGRDTFVAKAAYRGLITRQLGLGNTFITLDGDISADSDGMDIYQGLQSYGDVRISTGTESGIYAKGGGIYGHNNGHGKSILNLEGDIHAYAGAVNFFNDRNSTYLGVRTGADSDIVSRDKMALSLINQGKGAAELDIYGTISGAQGIHIRNYGTSLNIVTRYGSDVEALGDNALYAVNEGSGSLSIHAYGNIRSYNASIFARNTGEDLDFTLGATGYIDNNTNVGIDLRQEGTGDLSATILGHVKSNDVGVTAMTSSGHDLDLYTGSDSVIETVNQGINLDHRGSGSLSFEHRGSITSGGNAIAIANTGGTSAGLVIDGTIESTGGHAILFSEDHAGHSLSTTATPIEIAGGRIIGDVFDNQHNMGFSPVTVTGDFASEGNFRVSSFDVAATGEFTLSGNNQINAYSGIKVDGIFNADGIGANMKGGDFTVNAAGRLNVRENFNIASNFTNNGVTHIATGKNLVVDTMSAGTGDLYFGFNTSADHALLTVVGSAADLTGQTLHIDVTGVSGLADNEQALLITGNSAIIGGPGGTRTGVDDSSVLWDFEIVDGTAAIAPTTNADLFLVAKQAATIPQLATTPNNVAAGNVLMGVQNTPNPELASVVAGMNAASTEKEFNEVLESVQPGADMSEAAVMMGFSERMMETVSDRLDILRGTGVQSFQAQLSESAGNVPEMPGLQAWTVNFGDQDSLENAHGLDAIAGKQWQSGFGRYSRQKAQNGIDGYKAVTGGAAIGIDTGKTYSDMIVGIAASYARSEIDADNANRTQTDIHGFQILAYATKLLPKNSYVDLMVSYAQNQNDIVRHDVGGVPGLTAKGDFTSRETGVKTSIGRHFSYNDIMISPSFKVDWLHYTADSYAETGAGGAGLTVDTNSLDSVEVGAAVKLSKAIKKPSGAVWLPEIHAGYSYDLVGDPLQKTAQFVGGGASFTSVSPDPARHRVNAGFGVTYGATNDWDYSLTYDLDMAKGYQAHALMARAAWKF